MCVCTHAHEELVRAVPSHTGIDTTQQGLTQDHTIQCYTAQTFKISELDTFPVRYLRIALDLPFHLSHG